MNSTTLATGNETSEHDVPHGTLFHTRVKDTGYYLVSVLSPTDPEVYATEHVCLGLWHARLFRDALLQVGFKDVHIWKINKRRLRG